MAIIKLKPSGKNYLWGGNKLITEYGVESETDTLAEAWQLSCHPDGPSMIATGPYVGMTLEEYIAWNGKRVMGQHCKRFEDFPILIKLIDAKEDLSIQVHPDDEYAKQNEQQYGKTELWIVVECEEGAYLYYGMKESISKGVLEQSIKDKTLIKYLNKIPIKKGDTFLIEAGTIHAIGRNTVIAEIQQNSNVTYRVYDYGRVDKNGMERELHIAQAIDVSQLAPSISKSHIPHVASCDYFTVDKVYLDGERMKRMCGHVNEDSFLSILVLSGKGVIVSEEERIPYQKGDSFFLPANSKDYELLGKGEFILTHIE